MKFAEKLRQLLARLGWSVNDLAQQAGVNYLTVRSYLLAAENPRLPTLATAKRLAKALGVSLDELADCDDL